MILIFKLTKTILEVFGFKICIFVGVNHVRCKSHASQYLLSQFSQLIWEYYHSFLVYRRILSRRPFYIEILSQIFYAIIFTFSSNWDNISGFLGNKRQLSHFFHMEISSQTFQDIWKYYLKHLKLYNKYYLRLLDYIISDY